MRRKVRLSCSRRLVVRREASDRSPAKVDLHITVDPQMSVAEAHAVAEEVERRVREQVSGIVVVLVHASRDGMRTTCYLAIRSEP